MFENACDESVTIRLQRPEDDEGIVQLLQAAFGRWPRFDPGVPAIEHLRWKRECNPEGLEYNCVAEKDGRIVGVQFFWIQQVKVGNGVVRTAQGHDFCVHPDSQGLGIRTGMKKFAYETVELNTEFSLSVDGDHPAMVHMVKKADDTRYIMANKVLVLETAGGASGAPGRSGVGTRRVERFDERVDEMCAGAERAFQLMVRRSGDTLNWRYADPRAGRYIIHIAEEDGRMLGYCVALDSGSRGYVSDLLVRPERLDVLQSLLGRTLDALAARGAETVQTWSPVYHPYQAALSEAGFSTKKRTWLVRARPRGTHADPVTFRDDPRALIHLTGGDCGVM